MISKLSHIMTLANSIIGVSVLAMPFCFKQCGIVLATLVLLLSSVLSRLACHFLIKSAVMSRRRNFELLAFHAFGHMGKFLVELFIIGFLVGTCIAFFVVMGDLGPQIVGKVIDKNPQDIRTSLLLMTSVFIVLPLGLLRNIDSLSSLCTATVIFYVCLVLKIIAESMQHVFAGDWYEHVYYWKPSGILQCVPIFSMALFCQTQLFEIYETIPNVSLEKMNEVVRGALNICIIVYLCVGFFGYIAFCTQPFTGNILMSLEPSMSSEMIKMGFVFSIAFSFPLVIFPCRASLNSLLFRRVYTHEPSINYLPETRFRSLTIAIVAVSLITGILIPNIEFVLGLVGSTIGVMICLIFPAIFFISISSKHTNERLLAQVILFIGICIMILSTYANLYALGEAANTKSLATTSTPLNQMNNLPLNLNQDDINAIANLPNNPEILPDSAKINRMSGLNVPDRLLKVKTNDVRQEPPIPVERIVVTEKPMIETQKSVENKVVTFAPVITKVEKKTKNIMAENQDVKIMESIMKMDEKMNAAEVKINLADIQKYDSLINSDAIKKEELELVADAEAINTMITEKHEMLRKTLEKHKPEQTQVIQVQDPKEILDDSKHQKQEKLKFQENILLRKSNFPQLYVNGEKEFLNNIKESNDKNLLHIKPEVSNAEYFETKSVETKGKSLVLSNNDIANINQVNRKSVREQPLLTKDMKKQVVDDATDNENKSELVKEAKLNSSKTLPKGPILNALTKRISRKSISAHEFDKSSRKIGKQKTQGEYSLPIALKMRNQTKLENVPALLANTSEENVQVLRRDILENREREKREINVKVEEINTKVTSNISASKSITNLLKTSSDKTDEEECPKENENVDANISKGKLNDSLPKNNAVEAPLIKTNVYLSEQKVANAISVDSSIFVRGEYVKLKQRDLKSVNTGEDCKI